jgi:hypothetical protein
VDRTHLQEVAERPEAVLLEAREYEFLDISTSFRLHSFPPRDGAAVATLTVKQPPIIRRGTVYVVIRANLVFRAQRARSALPISWLLAVNRI